MKIKKIVIIISLLIFALFVGTTRSYAADETTTHESLTVPLYDGSEFIITNQNILSFKNIMVVSCKTSNKYYNILVLASNEGAFAIKVDGSSIYYTCVGEDLKNNVAFYQFSSTGKLYMYDAKTDINNKSLGNPLKNSTSNMSLPVSLKNIAYSSYDVLTYVSSGVFTSDVFLSSTTGNGSFFYTPPIEPECPTIGNSSASWDTGIFDYISVYSNDIVGENWRDFYLLAYDYSTNTEENPSLYPKKVIPIQNGVSSKYYTRTDDDYGYVFMVPTVDLGLSFKNGNNYALKLAFKETEEYEGEQIEYYDYVYTYKFTVANLTDEEIMQDKQDTTNNLLQEQQEILKEQHNTSKGIFATIKEILSYLNPFSENFFAYKLVGLILDGLKSLFVPSDGFFETFFEDMKEWFSERLGFLFYPFELIIDILNKILNVNFSEPIFNIPDINEPFTNTKLIGATTYNLNSLLSNSILENVHNIYLIVVDSIIVFALVNLAKRKFEEVTSK